MPNVNREFIPNQIFVGLPWKNARQKYDRLIKKLEARYPLHFTIVGRNDGQDAEDLFEIIKERISSSSYAIFDATGGNASEALDRVVQNIRSKRAQSFSKSVVKQSDYF